MDCMLMHSRLSDKTICLEARHDLKTRKFIAERENMQHRWSSDPRATADGKFREFAMRWKCPAMFPPRCCLIKLGTLLKGRPIESVSLRGDDTPPIHRA